jgi:hypothetical protein
MPSPPWCSCRRTEYIWSSGSPAEAAPGVVAVTTRARHGVDRGPVSTMRWDSVERPWSTSRPGTIPQFILFPKNPFRFKTFRNLCKLIKFFRICLNITKMQKKNLGESLWVDLHRKLDLIIFFSIMRCIKFQEVKS